MDIIPEGYKQDGKGALIPMSAIKPEHLEEDALVHTLTAEAKQLRAMMAAFREKALGEVSAFRELIAEKYGAHCGSQKGNVTLSSFDGRLQVQIAISDSVDFGPELEAAKALIDACVLRWSAGANENIQALIEHAFQTNKQGRIDTTRVLGLRRLKIEDEEWLQAMAAISDAVRVTSSKTYIRFYDRYPATNLKENIPLDLANA